MKVKCAWCQKDISGSNKETQNIDFPISHGICKDCSDSLMSELDTPLKKFINSFEVPVMLVDNRNNAILINQAAREVSSLHIEVRGGPTCGMVVGCIHSDEPEGCGATVHCEGCVIRRSILYTYQTDNPCLQEACNDDQFYSGKRVASLKISTEKLGNRILLKIDPISPEKEK